MRAHFQSALPGLTRFALNAAPSGAKIRVCPGIYKEQVAISKFLTINGDNGAIVMPSSMLTNRTSLASGNPISGVILVQNATDVTLSGLIVDGANNGVTTCGTDLIGIYYRNASGTVQKNTVRNMKLGPGLEGCQSGLGIYVQSRLGKSKVTIDTNSVHDFQKNGIQIAFGATGTVDSNIAANHVWSPCVSLNVCTDIATDILVYSSDGIEITRNIAGRSQSGVFVQANNSNVHDNNVFDTLVFDGIGFQGDNNKASNNTITKSDESGVFVDGKNNKVTGNTIQDAPIGVLKTTASAGTVIQGNTYINVLIPVVDPPAAGGKASAYR